MEESEFIYLRKFKTVRKFLNDARTLDHVLENIETFSNIARFMNRTSKVPVTPGFDSIVKQETGQFGKKNDGN